MYFRKLNTFILDSSGVFGIHKYAHVLTLFSTCVWLDPSVGCNQDQCTTIWGRYSGGGNRVCCPTGMTQWGDGSACDDGVQARCKLFGNPALSLCSSVSERGASLCTTGASKGGCWVSSDHVYCYSRSSLPSVSMLHTHTH